MKKRNKTSLILPSLLTIIGCIAIASGSTYSLFTSSSENNITISSGKVDVVSSLSQLKTYSKTSESSDYIEQENGSFYLGGSASISSDNSSLEINNITPGDKFSFTLTIKNNSTVSSKIRYSYGLSEDSSIYSKKLLGKFNIVSKINDTEKSYKDSDNTMISYKSGYETLDKDTNKTIDFTFELPIDMNESDLEGVNLSLSIKVEAIQGNADTTSDNESYSTYIEKEISDASSLTSLISSSSSDLLDLTLKEDTSLSSSLDVGSNDLIIDLNNNTLSTTDYLVLADEGSIDISNGSLSSSSDSPMIALNANASGDNNIDITLENVKLNKNINTYNASTTPSSAFIVLGANSEEDALNGDITIKNCEFKTSGTYASYAGIGITTNALSSENKVNINIEDTIIECLYPLYLPANANVNVSNSTFTGHSLICGGSNTFKDCVFTANNGATNISSITGSNLNKDHMWSDYEAYSFFNKTVTSGAAHFYDPLLIVDKRSDAYTLSSLKFNDCKVNASTSTSGDIIFGVRYLNMSQTLSDESKHFTLSDSSKIDLSGISWGDNSSIKEAKQLTTLAYYSAS